MVHLLTNPPKPITNDRLSIYVSFIHALLNAAMKNSRPKMNRFVGLFCSLAGINQPELVEYLTGLGHPASLGSAKAWNTNKYSIPPKALDDLYALWVNVRGNHSPVDRIGRPLPLGALNRQKLLADAAAYMTDADNRNLT